VRETVLTESDVAATVVVTGAGAHSKAFLSAKSWDALQLRPELKQAVLRKRWETPSHIQAQSLPLAMGTTAQGQVHLIGQAMGGSGKTGAFAIAALQLLEVALQAPQAIIITPTKVLATQVRPLPPIAPYFYLPAASASHCVSSSSFPSPLPHPPPEGVWRGEGARHARRLCAPTHWHWA